MASEKVRLYHDRASADYPRGCIAIADAGVLSEGPDPILNLVKFSQTQQCRSWLSRYAIVVFEDVEVPRAACERLQLPVLKDGPKNAHVHVHKSATGMLTHGSPVHSFLASDEREVRTAYRKRFGSQDVHGYYRREEHAIVDMGNNRHATVWHVVERAIREFQAGRYENGRGLLNYADKAIQDTMPVLKAIAALQDDLRAHLVVIPLDRFPTVFFGENRLHGRLLAKGLGRGEKDPAHSLTPLECPNKTLGSEVADPIYPEFMAQWGRDARAFMQYVIVPPS